MYVPLVNDAGEYLTATDEQVIEASLQRLPGHFLSDVGFVWVVPAPADPAGDACVACVPVTAAHSERLAGLISLDGEHVLELYIESIAGGAFERWIARQWRVAVQELDCALVEKVHIVTMMVLAEFALQRDRQNIARCLVRRVGRMLFQCVYRAVMGHLSRRNATKPCPPHFNVSRRHRFSHLKPISHEDVADLDYDKLWADLLGGCADDDDARA